MTLVEALVVTATDDASVMQGYAAIKTLLAGDASVPIHTLVNLADGSPLARIPRRPPTRARSRHSSPRRVLPTPGAP